MAESYVGLQEPSTVTKSLRTVTHDIAASSGVVHQEVMTLGGANSSLELARVQATAPASTAMGLVVRIAGGPSSAADLAVNVSSVAGAVVTRSSAADMLVTVYQSSAAALQATVTPVAGSTWRTQPGSTLWASSAGFHFDSSGALQVTGATASSIVTVARMVGNSSAQDYMPVRIVNSSGDAFAALGTDYPDGSTTSTLVAPGLSYNNGSNATMRLVGTLQPLPVQLRTGTLSYESTTTFITSTHSTAVYALVSSVAASVHKVYAIHVTSTHTRPSTIVFMSSLVGDIWAGCFGSGSSGVTGFNMAVTPPAFLFKTRASEALNVRIEEQSSVTSTTLARVSFSYFTE